MNTTSLDNDQVALRRIHQRDRLDLPHLAAVAGWWHGGISSALYQFASSSTFALPADEYLSEIRALCRTAHLWGVCEQESHAPLYVLHAYIRENVPDLNGHLGARITHQDLRTMKDTWYGGMWRRCMTRCEHDYYLSDSCPGCDWVEEAQEDWTPKMRTVYWKLVAHQSTLTCPDLLHSASLRALARRGHVTLWRNSKGMMAATPSSLPLPVEYQDEYQVAAA